MRVEKQFIGKEYLARLNNSPFFIVVDYQGLKVAPMTELRKRLAKAGAEIHVVKNSIFRLAAKEANIADLGPVLTGQLAVVTGQRDASAAAKTLKTFQSEFERPKLRFGYLGNNRLEAQGLLALADLPPLEVLRGKILGLVNGPAAKLAATISTPASQLVRVLQARAEQTAPAGAEAAS
jgi:large subunit ribosomal protein L10